MVFGILHGAGAGTLRHFLLLAGLSDWIACSESTLRRTQARVVGAIGSWGDDTLQRLGRTMPRRELTLVLDETWKRLMILVAMDAPSGFILVEKHSTSRDGAAWNEAIKATFKHLKVRVLQVVADEARGISNYVQRLLGAHRASDLFHGLHDLGAAVGTLHRKRAAAQAAVLKAVGEAKKQARAPEFASASTSSLGLNSPTARSRPPNWRGFEEPARRERPAGRFSPHLEVDGERRESP